MRQICQKLVFYTVRGLGLSRLFVGNFEQSSIVDPERDPGNRDERGDNGESQRRGFAHVIRKSKGAASYSSAGCAWLNSCNQPARYG